MTGARRFDAGFSSKEVEKLLYGNPHLGDSFRSGFEYACHYTSAETALFHILPSEYNHDFASEENVIQLRLNPIGQANDIEEGEYKLSVKGTDHEALDILFLNLKSQIKEEFKVFCLSWSNLPLEEMSYSNAPFLIPPMWSRYGRVHTGAVIIFDLEKLKLEVSKFFSRTENGLFDFKRVIYGSPVGQQGVSVTISSDELLKAKSPVDLRTMFRTDEGKTNFARLNTLFFKPPHWNYEREIRIVAHVPKSGPIPIRLPSSCVRGVILGAQSLKGYRKLFQKTCAQNGWFLLQHNPTEDAAHGILSQIE